MENRLKGFESYLAEGAGAAALTSAAYRRDVSEFAVFLDASRPGWDWPSVGENDVLAWMAQG